MLKFFIRIVLVSGLVFGNSSLAFSGDVYAEIVDYGIYTAKKAKAWKMAKTTTKIPMKVGTRFGVLFNLKGRPKGTRIRVAKS